MDSAETFTLGELFANATAPTPKESVLIPKRSFAKEVFFIIEPPKCILNFIEDNVNISEFIPFSSGIHRKRTIIEMPIFTMKTTLFSTFMARI